MTVKTQFQLYSLSGIPHVIEITADDPDKFKFDYQRTLHLLSQEGFSETVPDPSLRPQYMHITGYVMGVANTRTKGTLQPCVYLFKDVEAFTFKAFTIYDKEIPLLPLGDVTTHKLWDAGEPGLSPLRATAISRGFMCPCDFTLMVVPVIDFKTGLARTKVNPSTKEEIVQYRFGRVAQVHKYPYRAFASSEDATKWAWESAGVFPSQAAATEAYNTIKDSTKPKNHVEMWAAWIAHINTMLPEYED